MKLKHFSPPLLCLLAVLAMVTLVVAPGTRLAAQPSVEDKKISMLSEALRARDAGDYAAADRKLAELAVIVPNDASVTRLRTEIAAAARARLAADERAASEAAERASQRAAAQQAQATAASSRPPVAEAPPMIDVKIPEASSRAATATGSAPVVYNATPSAEAEADALVAAESARINAALTEAKALRATARAQLRDGNFEAALVTLDTALAALPINSLTQKNHRRAQARQSLRSLRPRPGPARPW